MGIKRTALWVVGDEINYNVHVQSGIIYGLNYMGKGNLCFVECGLIIKTGLHTEQIQIGLDFGMSFLITPSCHLPQFGPTVCIPNRRGNST